MFKTFLTGLALSLATTPQAPADLTSHRPGDLQEGRLEHRTDTLPTRWDMVPEESEARYRVQEQLAGFDFPNDAVGKTKAISGALFLGTDLAIDSRRSEFRVQLTSLTTDNERRDGYVRRRTLEAEEYPEAVLVPLRFVGLESPLPESGSATFRLEGNLTLHGVTQPIVWEVMANFSPDAISGLATTVFPFDTFGIAKPSVARVLSVADEIRLELEFKLIPGEG